MLIGIDIGTSSCKAALFTPDGKVISQASADYAVSYPKAGWAEQDPEDWWASICAALKSVTAEEKHKIEGIGIAGQSWSAIAIDRNGKCLCPTPIWMDTRAADICAEFNERIGADKIFEICGNPLQAAYTLPKILWYQRNLPEVYAKADKILQSNAYIAYKLTGEVSQDICQAYGLQVFNMRSGKWDDALISEMGIRRDLLCEPVSCSQIVGYVTKEAAEMCGLSEGIPVVAGGLDAACGALGVGVLREGETQEQGGQAGGMSICAEKYLADPRLILSYHVVPDRWLIQGGSVGGGGVLRWMKDEIWPNLSYQELGEQASVAPAGSDGLVFLPYMAGERSPIWDVKAKGVYYGLDYGKTSAHIIRAGLEGAAFALRHNLEVAEKAGAKAERLRAMGGAANSLLWTQIKSDVCGKIIDVPSSDTATTLGAAMLAGVASGVYADFLEAVNKTVKIERSHKPNTELKSIYDRNYETYREIYENLKTLMQKGAGAI